MLFRDERIRMLSAATSETAGYGSQPPEHVQQVRAAHGLACTLQTCCLTCAAGLRGPAHVRRCAISRVSLLSHCVLLMVSLALAFLL
jgi:hypothetical protein